MVVARCGGVVMGGGGGNKAMGGGRVQRVGGWNFLIKFEKEKAVACVQGEGKSDCELPTVHCTVWRRVAECRDVLVMVQ